MTKPTGNPPGAPPLKRGERTVRVDVWLPESLRRKLSVRCEQLGMSRSEWLRRIVENACRGIPSDAADDV